MRRQLLFLLSLCSGISASASTIEAFEVVSSSLRIAGGVFTSGSGTFSGSIQLDVSEIPGGGSGAIFGPTSFDIFTDVPEHKVAPRFLAADTGRCRGPLEAL
jgi:hypothetical protein